MTEMTLRSITNSGIWIPMLAPTCSTMISSDEPRCRGFNQPLWCNSVELSEQLLPKEWTWEWLAYPPVHQGFGRDGRTGEGSCVICSLVMCIHARYRLQYERRHGLGSFPFEVAMDLRYLKAACRGANIWRPAKMGTTPARVLELLESHPNIGVKTELFNGVPGPTLRPSSWGEFYSSLSTSSGGRTRLNHSEMARLLRLGGPVVGALHAGPSYRTAVHPLLSYNGADATDWAPNHATLCVGYHISEEDIMDIKVLDNQDPEGPVLWVRYEWFDYFTAVEFEEVESRIQAMFRHIRRIASSTA
ncbi:hypothetical protein TRIUR3_14949 [Triticum urartu]|uniref:Peptidase C1A papain C-terminal domain-containing protein n=1 Tax=Triticum urartu TaxID=4572 RepID=M8AD59_TRIUA|nr:hypothetical protein TRIUR3_14949 [Triticum urartu]